MTEQEYRRGNRIAATYFLQAVSVALMIFALYLGYREIIAHQSARFQAMIFGTNLMLFIFQGRIRARIFAQAEAKP